MKKILSIILGAILLGSFLPFQSSQAFVNNQFGTNIVGTSADVISLNVGVHEPHQVKFDAIGNMWVVDTDNNRILKFSDGDSLTTTNAFTTGQAASVVLGQPDLKTNEPNNGRTTPSAFTLKAPEDLVFDGEGNLWVSDSGNNRVVKFSDGDSLNSTSNFSSGQTASVVLGQSGFTTNSAGTSATTLNFPVGLAYDSLGNLWVVDRNNSRVLKFSDGDTSTSANNFTNGQAASIAIGQANLTSGSANQGGSVQANTLNLPEGITFDGGDGHFWVADSGNNRLLHYSDGDSNPATDNYTTNTASNIVLGQSNFTTGGSCTSPPTAASLCEPFHLTYDTNGSELYVADAGNDRIVMFSTFSDGASATKVLGQSNFTTTPTGQLFAPLTSSTLIDPSGLAFDGQGRLWVADTISNRIVRFNDGDTNTASNLFTNGQAADIVIGQGTFNVGERNSPGISKFTMWHPLGATFDSLGNLWVADAFHDRIVMYSDGDTNTSTNNFASGVSATKVLGQSSFTTNGANQNGAAGSTTIFFPTDLVFDSLGQLWVADQGNNRVLMYSDGDTNPATNNFANGQAASLVLGQADFTSVSADRGGSEAANTLHFPTDVDFDSLGNLWVVDSFNKRVLKFTDGDSLPSTSNFSNGQAASVVLGQSSFTTTTAAVSATGLTYPYGLAIDSDGNVWVTDLTEDRVLRYNDGDSLSSTSNFITGQAANLVIGQTSLTASDTGTSTKLLNTPQDIAFDSAGDLWVADDENHRIIEFLDNFSTGQAATTVIGQPDFTTGGNNTGGQNKNTLSFPAITLFDGSGNLWTGDLNGRIVKFPDEPSSTVVSTNQLTAGSNTPTIGSFSANFTSSGIWGDANINIQQTDANPVTSSPGGKVIGKYYEAITNSPGIITFPATVTINATTAEIAGFIQSTIKIARFDGSSWSEISSSVGSSPGGISVSGQTSGFSVFTLNGTLGAELTESLGMSDSLATQAFFGPGPNIESITASDPDPTSAGISAGDIITVLFDEPTNQPLKTATSNSLNKTSVDAIFTGATAFGADYTATWLDSETLRITLVDTTGSTAAIGATTLTVNLSAQLQDSEEKSNFSTDTSPVLAGDFGVPSGPFIRAFVADDPFPNTDGLNANDVVAITFSESTNQPLKGANNALTKANVDTIFGLTGTPTVLGTNYTATWETASLLNVTLADPTGATVSVGTTTLTVAAGAGLKNEAGTSAVSTPTTPVLTGSFDRFSFLESVSAEATYSTILPTGNELRLTLPTGSSGGTVNATTADTATAVPGGVIGFLSTVLEIKDPPGNQCQIGDGCLIAFTFTQDDADALGITPNQVRILHDRSDPEDGDFDDPGEILDTTITTIIANQLFEASATEQFTSKFAIGGVAAQAIAALGGSGDRETPTISDVSFSLGVTESGGFGGILSGEDATKSKTPLEIGKATSVSFKTFEHQGINDFEHISMYFDTKKPDLSRDFETTHVRWEKDTGLTINDPNGILESANIQIIPISAVEFEIKIDFAFAQEMDDAHLILAMWDLSHNAVQEYFPSVLQVISPEDETDEKEIEETVETLTEEKPAVPAWVKNNAGWWNEGQISTDDFVKGIGFLVEEQIIQVEDTTISEEKETEVPVWIQSNAGWWAEGLITDEDFVNAIEWLIQKGIVTINLTP